MTDWLGVAAILVYIISSAFLENGLGGRIVASDGLLAAIAVIALVRVVRRARVLIPAAYVLFLPLFCVLLISTVFSANKERAMIEMGVIVLGVLGSLALINASSEFSEASAKRFFEGYILGLGALALLCVIDFVLMPGLISSRNLGGLQGPFRNTGQAGSFFGTHGAIIVCLLMGRVVKPRLVYLLAAAIVIFALLLTVKRAAVVGFGVGMVLLIAQMIFSNSTADKKLGASLLGVGALAVVVLRLSFLWAMDNVPGMKWRVEYKVSEGAIEDFSDGFFASNITSSLSAFSDRPLIGVGLDNVRDVYQHHEIHSTYLAIIAYSGIAGVVCYGLFMSAVLRTVWRRPADAARSVYSSSLYYLFPLIIGLMVSWVYTYHLRKREFWVLMFVIVLLTILDKQGLRGGGSEIGGRWSRGSGSQP